MRQIFLTLILFLPTIVNATGVFQGAWLYSSKSCDNRYSYQYSLIQKGALLHKWQWIEQFCKMSR